MANGTVAGFISVDGIFDLEAALRYFEPEQVEVIRTLFGPDAKSLAEHSTSFYLGSNHAPLLIVDSADDERVCLDAFRELRAQLVDDRRTEFLELAGLGHNEVSCEPA